MLGNRSLLEAFASGCPLPAGFGDILDERIVEYPWLFSRLKEVKDLDILDAGSVLNFPAFADTHIARENRLHIATLAPETNCLYSRGVGYVFQDLRGTFFKDASFDVVLSLSTLEHVGMNNRRLYTNDECFNETLVEDFASAARELRRITRPGGRILLTVPCGTSADLDWLILFDDARIERLVEALGPASSTVTYYRHFGRGWDVAPGYAAVADAKYSSRLIDKAGWVYDPFRPGAEAVACIEANIPRE